MRTLNTLFYFFISLTCFSQSFHIGLFGGISNYQGDLVDNYYIPRFTRPAFGLTGTYELSERVNVRAGLTVGKLVGHDRYNTKDYLQLRNLSFESRVAEFSLLGELHIFNLNTINWTPYVFGGIALFKFNPYTNDSSNTKTYLKPLSTEGQGLPGYDTKPYSLVQFAIPVGFGVKYAITDRIRLGLEAGFRKTFTDYIDDVSTNYTDANDLLAAHGQQSVALAYRGDEVANGDPVYPAKGSQRGSSSQLDLYYFTGFHLTYRLGGGNGLFGSNKKSLSCPIVKP